MLVGGVFLHIVGANGQVCREGQGAVCLDASDLNQTVLRNDGAICCGQVFGCVESEINIEDLIAGADLEQLILLQILIEFHQDFLAFIVDGYGGAGDRHFLSGVLKLHRNGFLIQHHAIRRFGFHDFVFAQVQFRAGGSAIRRSGQGIHHLACAVTKSAIRCNNVLRSPDLKLSSFQARLCVNRLIPILQLSFLNLHGRELFASFFDGDGSFLRGVFFLRNHNRDTVFADRIFRRHIKIHGIGIQDISVGRFDLNNGIAFPKRKYLRRDEPAFLIGHKLGMLLYLRIGGGHGDQVAIGIINFKGGSGVGDGFSRFCIYFDNLQIGFKLGVVDKVLIGLSMFVDRDRKGRHILGAIPSLGLFHNIFPIGELFFFF